MPQSKAEGFSPHLLRLILCRLLAVGLPPGSLAVQLLRLLHSLLPLCLQLLLQTLNLRLKLHGQVQKGVGGEKVIIVRVRGDMGGRRFGAGEQDTFSIQPVATLSKVVKVAPTNNILQLTFSCTVSYQSVYWRAKIWRQIIARPSKGWVQGGNGAAQNRRSHAIAKTCFRCPAHLLSCPVGFCYLCLLALHPVLKLVTLCLPVGGSRQQQAVITWVNMGLCVCCSRRQYVEQLSNRLLESRGSLPSGQKVKAKLMHPRPIQNENPRSGRRLRVDQAHTQPGCRI